MTMNVWNLKADCNNDVMLMVEPQLDAGGYFRRNFIGQSIGQDWQSPPIDVLYKKKRLRDFVHLSGSVPVISQKAKDALAPFIASECEILPLLELRGKPFYAINVLNVIDCLDIEKSDISWAPDLPRRIWRINKYIFDETRIPQETMLFKIPNEAISNIFVTRKFIDCVIDHGLRGAAFRDPSQDNIILSALGKPTNVIPGLPE
jgi:hypothetical protein